MILLHVTQRIKKSKKMYPSKVVFSSFPCIHVINFFYSYYCYSLWMSETVNLKNYQYSFRFSTIFQFICCVLINKLKRSRTGSNHHLFP